MSRVFIAAIFALLVIIAVLATSLVMGQTQPLPNYYILALQKCNSSAPHTMHGLWPQYSKYKYPSNCGGPSFSISEVADLLPQMSEYWLSCPSDNTPNDQFWSHEWSKHGSCSGWDEHTYFQKGLQTYLSGEWKSQCDSYEWTCKIRVSLQPPEFKPVFLEKIKN